MTEEMIVLLEHAGYHVLVAYWVWYVVKVAFDIVLVASLIWGARTLWAWVLSKPWE